MLFRLLSFFCLWLVLLSSASASSGANWHQGDEEVYGAPSVWPGSVNKWLQNSKGVIVSVGVNLGSGGGHSFGKVPDDQGRPFIVTSGNFKATYYYDLSTGELEDIVREKTGGGAARLTTTVGRDGIGRQDSFSTSNDLGEDFSYGYGYNARNLRTSRTASSGSSWTGMLYDSRGRLTDANLSTGVSLDYGYDDRNNRDSGGGPVIFANNGVDQVTGQTLSQRGYGVRGRVAPGSTVRVFHPQAGPDGEEIYADPSTGIYEQYWIASSSFGVGVTRVELLVRGTLAGAGAGGSNAVADKQVWVMLPPISESLEYDGAGRLEADSLWTYQWNAMGRLTKMVRKEDTSADPNLATEEIAFTYDAEGRRTQKVRSLTYLSGPEREEKSKLFWDGWLPVCEELSVDGGTASRRWYVWGQDLSGTWDGAGGIGGLLAIQEDGGRTLLPVHDGLGNITAVINQANGETVARYDYSPYGELLSQSGEVNCCPFRYQSKYLDAETGLSYFGYRYYSAKLGRWISRDPLGEAGGFNLYGYCGNDPVNRWDYLGMWDVVQDSLQITPVLTQVGLVFKASVEVTRSWSSLGVASGMYNPAPPIIHHQAVRVPVNLGIHARLLLAKGGGPLVLYWAEQEFLQSARNEVDGMNGNELVSKVTATNEMLSILPGWQVGESIANGECGSAPIYLGRDLLLWGTGTKFIQAGATMSSRVGRGVLVGMGQGFTAATVDIGIDRARAGLGEYAYEGSWRSDGIRMLWSTGLGGFGGGVVGRFIPAAKTPAWNFGPAVRGQMIEQAWGHNLPNAFKTFDRFDNGVATSIKSFDLDLPSFAKPNGVWNAGRKAIDAAIDFEGYALQGVRITPQMIQQRSVRIAIPRAPSAAQASEFLRLQQYGADNGIFVMWEVF